MKRTPRKLVWVVIFALGLISLPAASNAQTFPPYMHVAPADADIATYGGDANALVVQIVNLTPYRIDWKPSSPWTNLQAVYGPLGSDAMSRTKAKSFMFAPLGVPQQLASPPAQAFEPPFLPNGQPNPKYIPDWNNTETRTYNMLFSWDDHAGGVTPNWVTWTIHDVPCVYDTRCVPGATQDVDLGLWITRDIPKQDTLNAGTHAELVRGIIKDAFSMLGVFVRPGIAGNWVRFFLNTAKLGEGTQAEIDAFNAGQTCDIDNGFFAGCDSNRHGQWWIAAHAYPDPTLYFEQNNQIYNVPNSCYTTTSDNSKCNPATYAANDGVETHWDTDNGGFFTHTIVVTTHFLRGHQATDSYAGVSACTMYPNNDPGKLGSAPVAMVTVMTLDQYDTAKVANLPLQGMVYTNGTTVLSASGSDFTCLQPGEPININGVSYTIQSVDSTTSLTLTSPAPAQKNVFWSAAALCRGVGSAVSARAPGDKTKGGVLPGPDLVRSLVAQYGRKALVHLHAIISGLPAVQRQFLRELIKSRIAGNPLTPKQEAFVHMIAVRVQADLR